MVVVPRQIDVGEVALNSEVQRTVEFRNLTLGTVQLTGAQASCGCVALGDFPVSIASGDVYTLKIKVRSGAEPSPFSHQIQVFTSVSGWESVALNVLGAVR